MKSPREGIKKEREKRPKNNVLGHYHSEEGIMSKNPQETRRRSGQGSNIQFWCGEKVSDFSPQKSIIQLDRI